MEITAITKKGEQFCEDPDRYNISLKISFQHCDTYVVYLVDTIRLSSSVNNCPDKTKTRTSECREK